MICDSVVLFLCVCGCVLDGGLGLSTRVNHFTQRTNQKTHSNSPHPLQ